MSAMRVRLTSLGSGSAGNCAYVETDEARILIDAGFSLRQIRKRLASIGRAPEKLTAILLTHEASDHVQGLALRCRHVDLSNEAAFDAAEQLMSAELLHLYLGHLSGECNRPDLAHRVMNDRLQSIGAGHVRLELASQSLPSATLQV